MVLGAFEKVKRLSWMSAYWDWDCEARRDEWEYEARKDEWNFREMVNLRNPAVIINAAKLFSGINLHDLFFCLTFASLKNKRRFRRRIFWEFWKNSSVGEPCCLKLET